MGLSKEFQGFNGEISSIIDRNLFDIVQIERECLVKIFECKENIDSEMDAILKKKDKFKKELLENLMATKKDLFKRFFVNYCKSKKLLEYSDEVSSDVQKYVEVEDVVRYNLGATIFNEVSKNDILNFFDKPLDYSDIYKFVDDFVVKFSDRIGEHLLNSISEGIHGEINNDFIGYFKNTLSEIIKLKICEKKGDLDLDNLFDLISMVLYAAIDNKSLHEMYRNFLSKHVDDGNKISLTEDSDNDDNYVIPYVKQLVHKTFLSKIDDLSFDGFSLKYGEAIADDTWDFIVKYLNSNHEFNVCDEDQFLEKIYDVYLNEDLYLIWKNLFLKHVKLPVNVSDIKLNSIEDSQDMMTFISLMKEKYPKAKNHIGTISFNKLKNKKIEFLKLCECNLINRVGKLLDNNDFKKLSLVQLFQVMHYYLGILANNSFDVFDKFIQYLKNYFEDCFAESDSIVRKKEEEKIARQNENKKIESNKSPNVVIEQKIEPVQKKIELSKSLLDDIDFYFEHIDDNPSDEKKAAVLAILMKISGKHYKKKWFKDIDLNDILFQNLDKNGYICESDLDDFNCAQNFESEDSLDISMETVDDSIMSEAKSLLFEVEKIDETELKIDKYFEILKLLGYSFYKKEKRIKDGVIDLCKSNNTFFTSFENTIQNIVNGNQVEEKKEKKWKNMPVYCVDIGGTGYRLVCFFKSNCEKRAIYAVMPHKEYITFLDKKCS